MRRQKFGSLLKREVDKTEFFYQEYERRLTWKVTFLEFIISVFILNRPIVSWIREENLFEKTRLAA